MTDVWEVRKNKNHWNLEFLKKSLVFTKNILSINLSAFYARSAGKILTLDSF